MNDWNPRFPRIDPARSEARTQAGAHVVVHSREKLSEALWAAADPSYYDAGARPDPKPSLIVLGDNIVFDRAIQLGAHDYDVVIDGGGQYGFRVAEGVSLSSFFDADENDVSGILFRSLTIDGGSTSANVSVIRVASSSASLTRVSFEEVTTTGVTGFLVADAGSPTWSDSTLSGNLSIHDSAPIEIADAVFLNTLFARNHSVTPAQLAARQYQFTRVRNASGSQFNIYLGTQPINDVTSNEEISTVLGMATPTSVRSRLYVAPFALGTASRPFLVFGDINNVVDDDTGLYPSGADSLSVAAGGVERFRFDTSGSEAKGLLRLSSAGIRFSDNTVQTTADAERPHGAMYLASDTAVSSGSALAQVPFDAVVYDYMDGPVDANNSRWVAPADGIVTVQGVIAVVPDSNTSGAPFRFSLSHVDAGTSAETYYHGGNAESQEWSDTGGSAVAYPNLAMQVEVQTGDIIRFWVEGLENATVLGGANKSHVSFAFREHL